MTSLTIPIVIITLILLAIGIINDIYKSKKRHISYKLSNTLLAYLFLLPALILIIIFVVQPIVMTVWYGFTDYYLLEPDNINFVGLENFRAIADQFKAKGDIYFALRNTIQFMVLVLPLQIGLALILALVLNRARRGNTYFKVAFFAPVVMSLTVTSILWMRILDPNPTQLGLMNSIFAIFGIPPSSFLLDPNVAMKWLVIISAWQGAGFQMLILLAGLKNIPNELYDAAKVDGADNFEIIRYITLPSLRPTLVFVIFTTMIAASKMITQSMVMIGFKNYSMTLSYLIYREGYQFRFVGYASALSLIFSVFVGTLIFIQRRWLRERG